MKMKQFTIFLFFLLGFFFARGEKQAINTVSSERIKAGDSIVSQNMICLTNNSAENLWIFFEPDSLLSNDEMIYNRFQSKTESGLSLFNCIMDEADWSNFIPDVNSSFVKIIKPSETFTIVTLNCELIDSVINSLRIIPQEEIGNIFKPLLLIVDAVSPVIYNHNVLVLP